MKQGISLCLVALVILVLMGEVEGWRRRRRRRCPVTNCAMSTWTKWSTCSQPCGTGGMQTRTRTVTKGATCGGSCSYPRSESRSCNIGCSNGGRPHTGRCSCVTGYSGRCCTGVDGGWSKWAAWTSCTKPCGSGSQERVRSCTQPVPRNNGKPCPGSRAEKRGCNLNPCPVHGGWSSWSLWGRCSKTCGTGGQSRFRSCSQPKPQYGGRTCPGASRDTQHCNTQRCPVHGGWSSWSLWGRCSKTCGTGGQSRSRSCSQPKPQYGGRTCPGASRDTQHCNTQRCPVDGGWSGWGFWSPCSKPCGVGTQDRSRSCNNPVPSNGGSDCSGARQEKQVCNTSPCPVNGGWSNWSSWTPCSKPCGSGEHDRFRSCTNPAPQNGGKHCLGEKGEKRGCNTQPCPMDGAWSVWGAWSLCDKSCGGGYRERTRSCTNPPPSFGGRGCGTSYHESSKCNPDPCSVNGGWSNWGNWSECSTACGTGTRSRVRLCDNPVPVGDGKNCTGEAKNTKPCSTGDICLIDIGCYGNSSLFPDLLANLRGEIKWLTTSFAEEMKRIVQKCATLAIKKKLRFFAVENFGKCYGDYAQVYAFEGNNKHTRCNFGVGLPNFYNVYMVTE